MAIKLIVGLGNPGSQYEDTRHNAGCWFIERFAQQSSLSLKTESKFKARVGLSHIGGEEIRFCIPLTYMNLSGDSVASIANFYKIASREILVVHDELDIAVGSLRLKFDGGHGGHNGLKSIFERLGTKEYYRLRIGIGHPGHRDDVVNYVLKKPSRDDRELIDGAIERALAVLPQIVGPQPERAMTVLHTEPKPKAD